MAMSFLSTTTTTTSSSLPLTVLRLSRHKHTSVPFSLKPYRSSSCSLESLLPKRPRFFKPTTNLLSSVATTSRTILFLLVASLLSFSGVRALPSLAAPPPPTQQPQETKGQEEEQQEPKEAKQKEVEEDEEKWFEEEEKEVEAAWAQPDDDEEEDQEEEDDEVQMYLEVLSLDPGDVNALKCVLFAKMRRKDWNGALRYARGLREAQPGEVEWRLMEALLHELKGELAEAERLFKDVLAEKPLLVRALHGLALCMHKRLEGPTVFEMLEKALQLAVSEERVPEERNIKLLIAQMHVVKGQLDVASEKLQNLINEDPRDFRPHLCQGIVYALLDRKEEADVQFDTYRSLVPDEFPDKSFINDVILAAKMESKDRLQKEFESEFLSKN